MDSPVQVSGCRRGQSSEKQSEKSDRIVLDVIALEWLREERR